MLKKSFRRTELVLRKSEWINTSRMKMRPIQGFNLLLSMVLLLCNVGSCYAEIRLLMSVFRHGDRYPMSYEMTRIFYPRNPHANVSWFPDSASGLTAEGKRNSFAFGNILRERYGEWLGPTYSRNLVDFRSSTPERTTITTALVAAGLFPPVGNQRWNPKLNWQPIPVSPVRLKDNILYLGGFLCSNHFAKYMKAILTDPTIGEYEREMRPFYAYVSRHIGSPATNRILFYLHMEFLALVSGGLEPPEWTEGNFPQGKFPEAAIMEYLISSWNDELKPLTGGVWLKEWLDHVDAYLELENEIPTESSKGIASTKKKAYFYGGHDLNVAGIMITLGIYYRHVPNYVSAVNFELHEDDDHQFYVKVLHRDSGNFTEYLVPGCDNILCPLDTFRNIFANITPQNLTEECGPYIAQFIP